METGGCRGLVVLECTNCLLHATVESKVEGTLSEIDATVSLSTVPRLSLLSGQSCCLRFGKRMCGEGWAVSPPTDLAVRSRRDQMTLPK